MPMCPFKQIFSLYISKTLLAFFIAVNNNIYPRKKIIPKAANDQPSQLSTNMTSFGRDRNSKCQKSKEKAHVNQNSNHKTYVRFPSYDFRCPPRPPRNISFSFRPEVMTDSYVIVLNLEYFLLKILSVQLNRFTFADVGAIR